MQEISLAHSRVHEISGRSAIPFGFLMARGPTIVCGRPDWVGALHPDGIATFAKAEALIHVPCPIRTEALWAAEVALRSGAVETVILATYETPSLTVLRRLQLAAEAGKALGLLLVTSPTRHSAAETRWYCIPCLSDGPDETSIKASLYKNKKGPVGSWKLHAQRNKNTFSMDAVPAGEPIWPERVAGQ